MLKKFSIKYNEDIALLIVLHNILEDFVSGKRGYECLEGRYKGIKIMLHIEKLKED